MIEMTGTVTEAMGNARFKVELTDSKQTIIAYIGGKMRQHEIKVIPGDLVKLEVSPYDLSKGRIMYRQ